MEKNVALTRWVMRASLPSSSSGNPASIEVCSSSSCCLTVMHCSILHCRGLPHEMSLLPCCAFKTLSFLDLFCQCALLCYDEVRSAQLYSLCALSCEAREGLPGSMPKQTNGVKLCPLALFLSLQPSGPLTQI